MNDLEIVNDYRQKVLLLAAIDHDLSQAVSTGAPRGVRTQQYMETHGTNNKEAASLQMWDGLLQRRNKLAEDLAGVPLR